MENWSKRYYRTLIAGLSAFAAILLLVGRSGASKPLLIFAFLVFYLAFKNGLQAWVKEQVAKEDPEYRMKRDTQREMRRDMWKTYLLPRTPWYRNESIAVVLLLILAFLFGLR